MSTMTLEQKAQAVIDAYSPRMESGTTAEERGKAAEIVTFAYETLWGTGDAMSTEMTELAYEDLFL